MSYRETYQSEKAKTSIHIRIFAVSIKPEKCILLLCASKHVASDLNKLLEAKKDVFIVLRVKLKVLL